MKTIMNLTLGTLLMALVGCADFPEKYENVIDGQKIRPFAVVLEPPEAAPGDTVRVSLRMYDAGKDYAVQWELGLKYQIDNYDALPEVTEIIDLESEGKMIDLTDDGLEFSFVVPTGTENPLILTDLIPQILKSEEELSSEEQVGLNSLGITDFSEGVKRKDVVELLDNTSSIPNEFSPLVDNLVALVQLRAKVTSPGFKLDVTKNLTVRYSNRLASGPFISNVNKNPAIDSIGIIRVHKKGVTDSDDISEYTSDTLFFETTTDNNIVSPVFDTLEVREDYSYFAFAAGKNNEQVYRSPNEMEHREDVFYDWFYTNLDDVSTGWEDLLTLNTEDTQAGQGLPLVALNLPKDKNMKHFTLRVSAMDWRIEWGALTSRGLEHKLVYGYFQYVD